MTGYVFISLFAFPVILGILLILPIILHNLFIPERIESLYKFFRQSIIYNFLLVVFFAILTAWDFAAFFLLIFFLLLLVYFLFASVKIKRSEYFLKMADKSSFYKILMPVFISIFLSTIYVSIFILISVFVGAHQSV